MSDWQPIPLATTTHHPASGFVSLERLINVYPEVNPSQSKTPVALYGCPGLTYYASVAEGPIRGMCVKGALIYVVAGQSLYTLHPSSGASARVGEVKGSGAVTMEHNGGRVAIATNQHTYSATDTDIIELPEQQIAGMAYMDGYVFFAQLGGEFLWSTDPDDLTDIDALDFTSVDAQTDNIVTCIRSRQEIWALGEETTEVYVNTGASPFPLERTGGGFMDVGCGAAASAARVGESVMWLDNKGRVVQAVGYNPRPVSTPAIERSIVESGSWHGARAFAYSHLGHDWYVLSTNAVTWAYDATTGAWVQRKSFGYERWKAGSYCKASDRHLVGLFDSADIYEIDPNAYDEGSTHLERTVITPPVSAGNRRVFMPELLLDMQAGVGLNSGQGSDPEVLLSYTDDGGNTWANDEESGIGAIGEYGYRTTWNRLGGFRTRSLRFSVTDPVPAVFLGAQARMEAGAS